MPPPSSGLCSLFLVYIYNLVYPYVSLLYLKTELADTSETLVRRCQTTWIHIPQNSFLFHIPFLYAKCNSLNPLTTVSFSRKTVLHRVVNMWHCGSFSLMGHICLSQNIIPKRKHTVYQCCQSQPTQTLRTILFSWQLVSTLDSGHHQAMTQEYEHIEKLKT
jgi:hypothetical protein